MVQKHEASAEASELATSLRTLHAASLEPATAPAGVTASRLAAMLDLAIAAQAARGRRFPAEHAGRALKQDLESLHVLFRQVHPLDENPEVQFLLDRVQAGLLAECRPVPSMPGPVSSAAASGELRDLADNYELDARRENRRTLILGVLAAAFAIGGVVLAVVGLLRATNGNVLHLSIFLGFVSIAAVLIVGSLLVTLLATRARTSTREALRLARQLRAIDPYLSSLPDVQRNLLKGVMLPRLFPRLLEDDDPLRMEEWPNPQDVLTALTTSVQDRPSTDDEGDVADAR